MPELTTTSSSGETGSSGETRRIAVDAELAQHRLDRLLALAMPDLSRSRLKQLIDNGHAADSTGKVLEPSSRVKPGAIVAVTIPPVVPALPVGQDMALTIVYEDAHVIVIDKPAGLVVHPAAGNPDGTLVNALIAHCGESLKGIGGEARPGIVHRIDKDTTGLIIAAKTEVAHRSLGRQFAAHTIERLYQAVVWGSPRAAQGVIEGNIARSSANRQKMAVVQGGGKTARTHYRVVQVFGQSATGPGVASLVECKLETGRTHQVRVHLAHLGHPLVGDSVYGRARTVKGLEIAITRQALHAAVLGFQHPATHKAVRFESLLPEDMQALLTALKAV